MRRDTFPYRSLLALGATLLVAGCPQPPHVQTDEPVTVPSSDPIGDLQVHDDAMPADTWRVGPPLARERGGLSVGVFQGQLFAIGGDGEASLDLFDAQQESWRTILLPAYQGDPSNRSRYFGAAVTAWNRLFYIGGTMDSFTFQLDVYDPLAPHWIDAANRVAHHSLFGRMTHAAVALDQEILLIGGQHAIANTPQMSVTGAVEAISPGRDTDTIEVYRRTPLPTPRAGLGAAALGSEVFVFGGFGTIPATGSPEATSSLLRYHADAWHETALDGTPLAPMHVPRHSFGAAVLDGQLYVAGGIGSDGLELDSVEAYDPATNRWTQKAPMIAPRAHLGLAALGGRLYAIGGYDAAGRPLRSVHVFRP